MAQPSQRVGAMREPELLEERFGDGVATRTAVQARDVFDVLANAQVVVEHRVVGDERQRGSCADGADRVAHDPCCARRCFEQTREKAEQCRFSGTVVADKCNGLAVRDREVERFERIEIGVALAEALDAERVGLLHGGLNSRVHAAFPKESKLARMLASTGSRAYTHAIMPTSSMRTSKALVAVVELTVGR